jgi:hypothetical protein
MFAPAASKTYPRLPRDNHQRWQWKAAGMCMENLLCAPFAELVQSAAMLIPRSIRLQSSGKQERTE